MIPLYRHISLNISPFLCSEIIFYSHFTKRNLFSIIPPIKILYRIHLISHLSLNFPLRGLGGLYIANIYITLLIPYTHHCRGAITPIEGIIPCVYNRLACTSESNSTPCIYFSERDTIQMG